MYRWGQGEVNTKCGVIMYSMAMLFFVLLIGMFGIVKTVHAVLPPDIVYAVGSQLVAFFSVFVVLLSSMIAAVTNTWRMLYGPIQHKKIFWSGMVVFVVLVSYGGAVVLEQKRKADLYDSWVAGVNTMVQPAVATTTDSVHEDEYLRYKYKADLYDKWVTDSLVLGATTTIISSSSTSDKQFFATRFVLYGKDADGKPFLLDVLANRKQNLQGTYLHYTFGDLLYDGVLYTDYEATQRVVGEVYGSAFVPNVERIYSDDLSSRESFTFDIQITDERLSVRIDSLAADFMVKNRPEYTKYISVGVAEVTNNAGMFDVYAAVQSSYSNDYSPYIFFDGYNQIEADSFQFILWDNEGSFYLFDQSTVLSDFNPSYTSHSWGLYKDSDGYMKRAFDVKVNAVEGGDAVWSISSPTLEGMSASLSLVKGFKGTEHKGLVRGVVTDMQGARSVEGLGYYRHISPR